MNLIELIHPEILEARPRELVWIGLEFIFIQLRYAVTLLLKLRNFDYLEIGGRTRLDLGFYEVHIIIFHLF